MPRATPELNNEIVRAGAGAGKTTRLTAKVLEVANLFFTKNNRAPKVMVTTFTRKATEELRERLVREACSQSNTQVIDFVTSHGNLHISTIHGVLSLFLRRYGHLIDFDSGFSIMEPAAAERLSRKVLRDILVANYKFESLLEHYSFDQLVALVNDFSQTRAEHGSIQPVDESELLVLLRVQLTHLADSIDGISKKLLADTHEPKWRDYCEHLLSCAALLRGTYFTSGADWFERLEMLSKPKFISKSPPFLEASHDELKEILKSCEKIDSEEFDPINFKMFADLASLFLDLGENFSREFAKIKLAQGQLEMKDLEHFSIQAIRQFPEVAQAFSAEWDYWLIDEFQDTSPTQVELLHHLIGRKPVFVVGDPQQSIYLFRGARSEVFIEEEKLIQQNDGLFSELKMNYRSRPELLLFFNDFFSQFDQNFLKMQPKCLPTQPQDVIAKFLIIDKEHREPLSPLVNQILNQISSGSKFEDFCVLARTNRELHDVAQYFESKNIPTHVHSTDGFFKRREILDVLSLLKFLLNPMDNLNFIRLVRSPWLKIEDSDLALALVGRHPFYWLHLKQTLATHATVMQLEALLLQKNKSGIFETLRNAVISLGIIDASHFHDSTGRRESNIWKFLSLLREREKTPGFSYLNFVHKAFQGQKSAEGDMESDAVAALEPNRVNLMTIHKAKGLKFKHVLIPNLDKRLATSDSRAHESPFIYSEAKNKFAIALRLGEERKLTHNLAAKEQFTLMSNREREEYVRVLYVAMTRAEQSVVLHWQEPIVKGSWASLLSLNLNEGVHNTTHYSYAVEKLFAESSAHIKIAEEKIMPRTPWCSDYTKYYTNQRLSVSRLVEERMGASINSNIQAQPDLKNLKHHLEIPVLGQKLHTLLERIKYKNTIDVKTYAQRWFADRAEDFTQAVEYVLNLQTPPVHKLIEAGEVEWGFQLLTHRGVLEGQIDLWGTLPDANTKKPITWVIDYKSGSSRYSAKAFEQLKLYSFALRAFGIENEIRLAVIYVVENKTEIQLYSDIEI